MLAKLICWGETRGMAIARMKRALREYIIVGVQTNIPFHLQLRDDPRFIKGQVHTGFLDSEFKMDEPARDDGDDRVALFAAAVMSHERRTRNGAQPAIIRGPSDTWRDAGRDRIITERAAAQGNKWRRNIG
jgi:acetyl/propionyl-CoA carboxylase alpha subunit